MDIPWMEHILRGFPVHSPDMLLSKAAVWHKSPEAHFAEMLDWIHSNTQKNNG